MNRIYKILCIIIACGMYLPAQAQVPAKLGVKLVAFRTADKVVLRWAMDDGLQWRIASKKGFNVERAEAGSNNFVKLNGGPILPITEVQARGYDTASAVFRAMAILLSPTPDADNFIYPLYLVQSSYQTEAAVASASGYVDDRIEDGKAYTYRVSVATKYIKQTEGTTHVDAKESVFPQAPDLQAEFGNRQVTFNWDMKDMAKDYFAIVIERSDDGTNFAPVGLPRMKVNANDEKPDQKFLVQSKDDRPNGVKYFYRILGINFFGLMGKPGKVVSGICSPDLIVAPLVHTVEQDKRTKTHITWHLPDSLRVSVAKYEVWQSAVYDKDYVKVAESTDPSDTEVQFTATIQPSNYFMVKAVGTHGSQLVSSVPYLYQPVDSLPPAPPEGLTGSIDTGGNVHIQWTANTESDILGYKVLRSPLKEKEFLALMGSPAAANHFAEVLPTGQLDKYVYYYVIAVDKRYNESEPSAILQLRMPDKIAPAPPRLESVYFAEDRIHVKWVKSVSDDVIAYDIYRQAGNDPAKQWQKVHTAGADDTLYKDKDIADNITYYYKLQAIDDANLKSSFAAPFSAEIPKSSKIKKGVSNLNSYISQQYKYIELNWQNSDDNAKQYMLYRAVKDGKLSLIATLPAKDKRYADEKIKQSVTYEYAVKVLYKDGTSSRMEKIEVAF